jgi:response regulator RpfG family c-di-GMP phosphodiesterase
MQLLWLAMGLIGMLTLALVLLVAYGLEVTDADYTEPLLLIGLLAFVTCTVAYFADKEREHRAENRRLIEKLQETAGALDKRVARLNKLSETSVRLAGALDLDRISELVVGALVDQVQADAASFVLMDTARGEYVHRRSTGALAEGDERETPLDMAAKAARGGPAIGELQQAPPVSEQLVAWDSIRASISAPMNVSEVVNGALAAIREESFDTEDLNLLTTLANMSSKAVESAELHQQLRRSYYRTLHVLARSLAARDPYSAAHGEAVTCLAEKIGGELRLSEDNIEALKSYGPLHDLGKIGISDVLLGKQGPLTEEEFELVRQHPLIGESIIRPLDPGEEALCMIRSHHERWDGKGYPDGLHGEGTPQLARVVAVADVYHAIVSHRPYRGGASPIRAVQEIKSMSSTQFDPTVVKALVNLWHAGALTDLRISGTEAGQTSDILEVPVAVAAPVPRSAG